MKVALTGATGYIGSHVLTELREHGHEVTALVRDDTRADTVAAHGAKAAVVDLYDRPAMASLLEDADGAIHTASPGDATTAGLESAVVDAVIERRVLGARGMRTVVIVSGTAYGDGGGSDSPAATSSATECTRPWLN